jgi:hypothetical protein
MTSTGEPATLPEGAVLLHIGPYKTGSTAIQQALFDRRDALAEHGVLYPGRWRRLFREGHALMQWSPRGRPVPPVSVWDDFAAGIRERTDVRVCLSTEDFGRIRDARKSHKVIEDLGADRLHVIAVARAYHRLMPSHWQERVKSHERRTYDAWLRELLEGDDSQEVPRSFWTSHDVEYMASRWLDVLPPERFTLVVTDDSDRDVLPRTFERMLGLPTGLLAPAESTNASLSMNAVEVLRRVNEEFAERGWSDRDYVGLVQDGMVRALQDAGRGAGDTPVPPLPGWARPLVAARSQRRVEVIERLGIDVVGVRGGARSRPDLGGGGRAGRDRRRRERPGASAGGAAAHPASRARSRSDPGRRGPAGARAGAVEAADRPLARASLSAPSPLRSSPRHTARRFRAPGRAAYILRCSTPCGTHTGPRPRVVGGT